MAKVYCQNCIFYEAGEEIPYPFGPPDTVRDRCLSPQNYKDSFDAPASSPVSKPEIINRFNNCQWYEEATTDETSSSSSSSSAS